MSKEIVFQTSHRYNWVQLGAAIKHPDFGKVLDISAEVNGEVGITDANVRIYPNNGYGDLQRLREIIKVEKPDALMIFTDPRYWIWLFQGEREIRSKLPTIYLNIWDNLPYPMWNKPYYESCDGLFAISKQTFNINKVVLGEKAKDKTIKYIPHGVSAKYFPIENPEQNPEYLQFRQDVRGGKEFVLLYNARNLGRKRTSDLILAWRHFCDLIGKEEAKKCRLVLHTDPVDNAGTDLPACVEAYCDPSYVDVRFIPDKFNSEFMNYLYNLSDGVILVSSAEGWGLSVTEALATGKMFIGTVTGGIQDQMRFEDEKGNWIDFSLKFPSNHTMKYTKHGEWCIPVSPEKGRSLVGSPMTPYIYDDRASIESIAEAIKELWSISPEERKVRGSAGREWSRSTEAGFTSEIMGERISNGIDEVLQRYEENPPKRYELIEAVPGTTYLDYDPVNYSVD